MLVLYMLFGMVSSVKRWGRFFMFPVKKQWSSQDYVCSEMGQFFVFHNVTGVDFLRICPRKIGSFCPPIKEKNVLWYFSCFNTVLFLGHVCYTERASSGGFSIKQLHSLPPGELTCFFWVLLLRDTAEMQIIVFFFLCPWIGFWSLLFIHVSIPHCFVIFKQYINLPFQNDHTSVYNFKQEQFTLAPVFNIIDFCHI